MLIIKYIKPDQDAYTNIELLFQMLLSENLFLCGLDTETTVLKEKNNPMKTSIMQICVNSNDINNDDYVSSLETVIDDPEIYTCYVFHLQYVYDQMKVLPPSLIEFLKKRNIIKVGCDISLDAKKIKKDYDLKIKGIIDIQDLSRAIGNLNYSLNSLSQKYLKLKKLDSKLGNYDTTLIKTQIEYAAYDAYLSLMLYKKMTKSDPAKVYPYFYVADSKTELVSIEDAKNFLDFLISMKLFIIKDVVVTYEKIFNITHNSYHLWRDNAKQCSSKIKQCLKLLSNEKILLNDNNGWLINSNYINTNKELLENEEVVEKKQVTSNNSYDHNSFYNRVVELTKKCITINGIKYESLLTSLNNSIPITSINFIQGKTEEVLFKKKEYINKCIDMMIKQGILINSAMNKLFLKK